MEKRMQLEKVYPLSSMQAGMLFHSELDKGSSVYFEQTTLTLIGTVNVDILEKSFNKLIARHDVLRTIFFFKNVERLSQVVIKEREGKVRFEDYSMLTAEEAEEKVEQFKKKDRENGFELDKDLLVRMTVIKLNETTHKLIWSFHHIIIDGWGISILNKELLEIYKALKEDTEIQLLPAPAYKDYIDWLEKQSKEKAKEYWGNYLNGYETLATLPTISEESEYIKQNDVFKIEHSLSERLKEYAKQKGVTLNIIFQAMWGIILQCYNYTNDVVFGAVTSGRIPEVTHIESMVGLFINTLPVRVRAKAKMSFENLIQEMQEQMFESEKYTYCSLETINALTPLKSNLFNNIMVFENYPVDPVVNKLQEAIGFSVQDVENYEQTNYDFNVIIMPEEEIKIIFLYNGKRINETLVMAIKNQLLNMIQQVLENPNLNIEDIQLIDALEKEKVLKQFNLEESSLQDSRTLQALFEEQVEKTPEQIALIYESTKITYKTLNEKVNQLAHLLRSKGVQKGILVGLMFERSIKMIISILAVVKAGASYLPLDAANPKERIMGIIEDAKPSILLTHKHLFQEEIDLEIVNIDLIEAELNKQSTANLEIQNTSEDIAYVMYTSGSTGKPKGTLIRHKGISRVTKHTKYIEITSDDKLLQLSNYVFDGSTFDIYGALLNGATLVLVNKNELLDMSNISRLIEEEQITVFFITTALFNTLVEVNINCFKNIRKVLFGGERVSVSHVVKAINFMGPDKMIHVYGPTESTTFATYYPINKANEQMKTIPIGRCIDYTQVYVLDQYLNLQPIGIAGELYISGNGLAKGYLNNEALTNERFIENPFKPGDKLYKTGDLVRWTEDGYLEYIDRLDAQVKLRGFRIELGEIESKLLTHRAIQDAVVLFENSEDNKYLYACIVASETFTVNELRTYLEKSLPDYMIPSYFVQVDKIPVTQNGKVDKQALRKLKRMDSDVAYEAPRNEIEEIVLRVWKEVLGVEHIGIRHTYFSQGGDSIKAIQIASRLQKYGLKMEIKDLLQHPTIAELSAYIKSNVLKINQETVQGEVLLTPIQKWFFDKKFTNANHFNQSLMLYGQNGFDAEKVKIAFNELIKHHDALRMVYKEAQYNRGIQEPLMDFKVIEIENQIEEAQIIEKAAEAAQENINLEEGPLVQIRLFKTSMGDHLLIVIHHLVVDGLSWRIILEDFSVAYKQLLDGKEVTFQQKTTSFKEWSDKLNEYAKSKLIQEEYAYWEKLLEAQGARLPQKSNSYHNRLEDSKDVSFELTKEETDLLLKEVNKTYNTEINDLLITALGMAISSWAKIDKFYIHLEGHGREKILSNVDINRTVGWFTTMYPVLLDMSYTDDLGYQIKWTKDMLNRIPNNGIGYGIIKYLSEKTFDVQPDIDISFNYLGQFDQDIQTDLFEMSKYSTGNNVSMLCERNHVLDINAYVKNERLNVSINYNEYVYAEEIQELIDIYKESIITIINHCMHKDEVQYSPTDFMYNDLSIEELDDLVDELDDILD